MKKSILSAVFALATLTAINAQAQDKEAIALNKGQAEKVEATAKATPATVTQDYKSIKLEEVPQAVKDAVAKDLEGATISEAAVNEKGIYKIVVATADKKVQTLYANAKGEWLKKE